MKKYLHKIQVNILWKTGAKVKPWPSTFGHWASTPQVMVIMLIIFGCSNIYTNSIK